MFRANNKCQISRPAGRNIFGKAVFSMKVTVPCSIVKLELTAAKSSVRADSSASRGAAEQEQAQAVILFPTYVNLAIDNVLTVAGMSVRITKVVPRFNAAGKHDHNETAGVIQEQSA